MSKEEILNYVVTGITTINFMMAMIVIVLLAACFLGRYIVISRKMLIATLGVILLHVVVLILGDFIFHKMNPELYNTFEQMNGKDTISLTDEKYSFYAGFITIFKIVLNAVLFIYAFIFYLVVYKEKKLLRAIESVVCLFIYYTYIDFILEYSIVYIKGGDFKYLVNVFSTVGGTDVLSFNTVYIMCSFVVTLTLLLVLYFAYYKRHKVYIVRVRERILFIVWLVLFAIFPTIPFSSDVIEEEYRLLSLIFGILLPVLGVFAPIILAMNAAERNLKDKNEYQETYLAAELDYIEQYKRSQTETRAFRHDIINNLSVVKMTLEENRTEEALEHLNELLGNVKALSPSIITGDEMLDCIVSMKADKMKEMSIDFKTDGVVDGGLHMKPMDVCSIFANALDNAIEASSKTGDKAWVDLNIKRNEKFFIIKIANSALEKVDVEKLFTTSGYTSKEDKEHHGFGLRNIRNTVEDNEGLLKAESGDDYFALSIMISR